MVYLYYDDGMKVLTAYDNLRDLTRNNNAVAQWTGIENITENTETHQIQAHIPSTEMKSSIVMRWPMAHTVLICVKPSING